MTTGNAYTPFVDATSFAREEAETPRPEPPRLGAWSPFLSVYEVAEGEAAGDYAEPAREAYSVIVNELYDEEFDEALFELLTEARDLHQGHLASGHARHEADRIVTQHFNDLTREAESMVDAVAREFGARDGAPLEGELEAYVERYAPAASLEPTFQNFFGKLIKKIGKGVRAVASTAAKFALGPILRAALNRIKPLIKPLLKRVLQKAIGRLPPAVQPLAQKVAQRFGFAAPAPKPAPAASQAAPAPDAPTDASPGEPAQPVEDAGSPVQAAAGPDVSELQLEFDEQLAEALLSEDEAELELEMARAANDSRAPASPVFADLEEARERFINELGSLKEGENPAPYVENFLPAVLPALRIAIRLLKRPRVVNFLAGFLGKLLTNIIGPKYTPALSRAIVDAGLKLLTLEAPEQDETRLATSAVAATVEETVRRVASLPDHVLDNNELLEGFALEAFEQAAAANLPALFSEATYRKRPELLEGGVNASWLMVPLRAPTYKRCSSTFNVRITPHMAEAIESFDGTPLSDYLQDQLGLPEGEDVEAEVYLYETLPGNTAADIARGEAETPGLGGSDEATVSQLQALTNEAAGVLLGKPGLGRALPSWSSIRTVVPGQRLYHLAIPGRRPLTVSGPGGRRRVRRLARVNVTLDFTKSQLRVCVFLSEVKAQRLAVRLRQQSHAGAVTVWFNKLLGRRLPGILHGRHRRRLRIVHAGVPPGAAAAPFMERLPTVVPQVFIGKLREWLVRGFSEFVNNQAQSFLSASEDPTDGVTLVFTIDQPPGLKELGQTLIHKGTAGATVAESLTKGGEPPIRVEALPGHKCG